MLRAVTIDGAARITWLGHSSSVLELDGIRLVTDPVFRPRVAHLKRVIAPASEVADVDAVLISHAHYDHLDLPSLRQIRSPERIIVPCGVGAFMRRRGFDGVVEIAAGEEVSFGSVIVRATPAVHGGWRPGVALRTPALGFLVAGSVSVYFAGDTGLFDGMTTLAAGLDLALLPVAGWGARIPEDHLDPVRAAQGLRLLRPRVAVPIHWGTYRMITLPRTSGVVREPADDFRRHAAALAPDVEVVVLEPGGGLSVSSSGDFVRSG
jgi:L-ascorbate metabolism protein UlaG (beta-lactamase superfamily)